MHRRHALAVLVALALLPTAALSQTLPQSRPEDVGMSSERLARLSSALDAYVDQSRLPGGVALVLRRGHVVYSHAFGYQDREAEAAMPEDAIFRIASQTKALVSVAILMLQEEGSLLISDPLSRHLPAFERTTVAVPLDGGGYDVVEARRSVTLRDLLTHTAGIGYGGGTARDRWAEAGIQGWYFAHRDEPVRATVDRMAVLPFDAQPGERFVYGYSTDILGAVVEAVSGMPLDAFLRTRILDPLGMRDTHFFLPPEKASRLATVYSLARGRPLSRAPDGDGMETQGQYVEGPRVSYSGGAGLLSTAADYARFLQMLLNGGELDGTRILSPNTVDLMTTSHIGELGEDGSGFGLGFSVVEDLGARGSPGTVGEFGWGGAYHSTYWVDPVEELVVVYMTQVIPAAGLDDQGKLRALIYQAILDSGRERWAPDHPPMGAASTSGSAGEVVANLRRTVGIAHEKLVALAGAIPEEAYGWSPMDGVRSVGDVFVHVAADNWFGPALMGIEAPAETGVTTEDSTVRAYQERALSKEEILVEMEASFQHLLAAMEMTTPRAGDQVSLRGNPMTMADLWVRLVVHMHEHLGQSVAYARSLEVVPPWSR
jgi:CubicO group peptidase (beta-lactamase class C family)/uncharacterized damage-inducible protein DinB